MVYRTIDLIPVKTSEAENPELHFSCLVHDKETLAEIQERIHDDDITACAVGTETGDYSPIYVRYGQPSFRYGGQWYKVIERDFNSLVDVLTETLPHGSGLNGTWQIARKGNKFSCTIDYDYMTANGFYDGSIVIRVHYTYLKSKNLLRFERVTVPLAKCWLAIDDDGNEYDDLPSLRDYWDGLFSNIQLV